MSELSFSTFAEFINAVDRANRLALDLPAAEKRLAALKIEEADMTQRQRDAALAVDNAKKEAKELRDQGEKARLEAERQGRLEADRIKAAARLDADTATAAANAQLNSIRAGIKKANDDLAKANADATEAQKKLDAINNQIASLKKLVA